MVQKKSISNAHYVVFLSRRCQNVEKVHETFINTNISFQKSYFSLIIEYGMYLKCVQKALQGSKQPKRSDPTCRKQG